MNESLTKFQVKKKSGKKSRCKEGNTVFKNVVREQLKYHPFFMVLVVVFQ